MSDQHQILLYVDSVSDESPVGLCQQVGQRPAASEEAVPSQITSWGCWSRQVNAAYKMQDYRSCQRHLASLEAGALNLAELRTQEEMLHDALMMPKETLWSPAGRTHSSWDLDTHRALPVMARLGHPQHLLFPLLMVCVSAAASREDEDASHTSCQPPYVYYLEDENPFMILSYFPLSQAAYQFLQLEKSLFLSDRRTWSAEKHRPTNPTAGLSISKDGPQTLEHNRLPILCRTESHQPAAPQLCRNSIPLPHLVNKSLLNVHIFGLRMTNMGYRGLPFSAICCLAHPVSEAGTLPASPGSCCCECHSSAL